jgi:flagellin-like hook-associated protein FlgL
MPIVLNTNSAATEATFNLSKANDNLRRSIARLSSGNRITKPTDDAGGLSVAYKLQSSVKRTEASLNNHQNALSFLQVQDGVLEAMGDIVDRMSELRTMAADVSKNAADVENYSKEFLELQDQLAQMKREKFNGVELFAVENEQDAMKGINKSHLIVNGELHDNVNGKTYSNKAEYEYFDDPLVEKRTKNTFDKYEFQLYTNPSGVEEDGNIKLNIVNLQFMLGIKDPGAFGRDFSSLDTGAGAGTANDGILHADEIIASGYDTGMGGGTANDGVLHADEIAASGLDRNGDGTLQLYEWAGYDNGSGGGIAGDGIMHADEIAAATDVDNGSGGGTAGDGIMHADEIAASGLDLNGDGSISSQEWRGLYASGQGRTIEVSETINLGGLSQPSLDDASGTPGGTGWTHKSNDPNAGGPGTNYQNYLTDEGYVKDITKISIEEFTNIIEKIADVRAENGAEQQRVNQSLRLQQNNLVNLEAAHGRIMDVDVALESTRLARHSVTVQASAAMVAQANQMTSVALTLLS